MNKFPKPLIRHNYLSSLWETIHVNSDDLEWENFSL